jgi:hypothetical protein
LAEGVQTVVRTEAAPESALTEACPSCGEALAGDYCHACGEKRPQARDLTVRHFAGDAAQELTSLDSKLLRTLVMLLFRPGRLTNEWIAGRRILYLKPLGLCLGLLAINLFVYTASKHANVFDIRFILDAESQFMEQVKMPGVGHFYADIFAEAGRRRGVPAESLYDTFNEKWQRNFSLLGPVQIVALAVLLQLVYFLSRRYFVEHLVFAMHFLSWATLSTTLMWPLYYYTGIHLTGASMNIGLAKFLVDIVYLFFALRAVYRGHPALAVLGAVVVFAGYFIIYSFTATAALFAALFAILRG